MSQSIQQPPHSDKPLPDTDKPLSEDVSRHTTYPEFPSAREIISQVTSDHAIEPIRRLILTLEGEIVREYSIHSRNLSIGRQHGNDIQLNDLTLSGRHALITSIPDYVFIEDLGSTNGTLVNGKHIKKIAIEHGDIIQIGHHQITYFCDGQTKYEPTMFIKAEHDETQFIYNGDNNEGYRVKGFRLAGLRAACNSKSGPVMELRKTYNTVGYRGKKMALITRGTDGYSISAVTSTRSRRSSDTPTLNGKPLGKNLHKLELNDIVSIAGYDVQFYFLD